MQTNPFDISFGKKPTENITRFRLSKEITDAFDAETVSQQIYLLTGVRGSGKTVLMNTIAGVFEDIPRWVVIRLNPDRDLLQAMGAKLCSIPACADLFQKARLNLSFLGLGIELEGAPAIMDIEAALEKMLKNLRQHGKRVLVTIDEVTNTSYVRAFCSALQIFMGQDLPLFVLMTGLYENIEDLQNEKNLTFLYRAPKLRMMPLNLNAIAARYSQVFSLSDQEALDLAKYTKGYPFAFQALGYSMWRHRNKPEIYLGEYRQLLEEYVYEKLWSELSSKDRRILRGIANCPDGRIRSINACLGLKTNEINQYRKRLIRKGILDGEEYGRLRFTLPLFDRFVLSQLTET